MTVNSSQRVGIRKSNINATVHIAQDSTQDIVRLEVDGTSGVSNVLRIRNSDDTSTLGMIKYDIDNNRMIFNRGGDVAGFTNNGLTFGSDTAAANALDDYEEGTFTPTINTGFTVSYDQQSGRYIKVGKLVTVWINIDTNTISGSSSDTYAEVEGLPFTARNASYIDTAVAVGWEYNLSNSVDHAYINGNTDFIVLLGPNSSGTRTHWSPVNVWNNNDTRIALTASYWTDE